MSILRQFVAQDRITGNNDHHHHSPGLEGTVSVTEEQASQTRARRDVTGKNVGTTTERAPPPPTTKKTKVNSMKNRIYTSEIKYPSVPGTGGAAGNPGGRIFNPVHGVAGTTSHAAGLNSTVDRERIRMEFYATYDVMTGIRIAATLGGFFAFVIILVMYKSRSHTNQALKDPKIVAVAAAVVLEEEERELQQKLDATGLTLYADDINYEYRRQRLLSLGGFDPALIDSPRRFSYGYGSSRPRSGGSNYSHYNASRASRRSSSEVPTISRYSYDFRDQYHQQQQLQDDEFIMVEQDEELELENEFQEIDFRSMAGQVRPPTAVPRAGSYDSRRCSSITCCSTESSYLERRCSALTLGIYSIGASLAQPHQQQSQLPPSSACLQSAQQDPLPGSEFSISVPQYPVSANRAIRSSSHNYNSRRFSGRSSRRSSFMRRKQEDATDVSITLGVDSETIGPTVDMSTVSSAATLKGTAPLASLSSFRISSIDPPTENDLRSLGSDSVFCEPYVDTDEEVAQFSSDSEEQGGEDDKGEPNVFVENPIGDDLDNLNVEVDRVNTSGTDEVEEAENIREEDEIPESITSFGNRAVDVLVTMTTEVIADVEGNSIELSEGKCS